LGAQKLDCARMLYCSTRTPEYRWQGLMKFFKNLALMYGQNITKFPEKCSDCSRHESQKSKYVQIVHQASKKPKFVRTGPSGPENS
jgi:hypothetical protein